MYKNFQINLPLSSNLTTSALYVLSKSNFIHFKYAIYLSIIVHAFIKPGNSMYSTSKEFCTQFRICVIWSICSYPLGYTTGAGAVIPMPCYKESNPGEMSMA